MKRKLFFIAVIVICPSLTAYGTLAYFTAEETAHNVITTGNVDIVLIDKIVGGVENEKEDGWSISGVMPGQKVEKEVAVKNSGSGAAWVRLKLTISITGANDEPLALKIGADDSIDVIQYTLDSNVWALKDGYIYYKESVPANGSTDSLFQDDIVQFAKEAGNEYQGCHVSIVVEAEAVQSANNGETYDQAKGWPTT